MTDTLSRPTTEAPPVPTRPWWKSKTTTTTFFTDDFNRVDDALGPNWADLPGVVQPVISGNCVIVSGTRVNNAANATEVFGPNQWACATVSLGPDYSEAGVLLHSLNADNNMLFIYTTDGQPAEFPKFGKTPGPALQLYFLVRGVPRFLGQTAAPPTGTHRLFGCNVGRNFQMWFDGVRIFDVEDRANRELALRSGPGFTVHRRVPGTETTLDDYAAGDYPTAPATPTVESFSPSRIPDTGGTVTVIGTGFIADATMVTIAGIDHPVRVTSATTGTFAAPAHVAEVVPVTLTSVGGVSASSKLTYSRSTSRLHPVWSHRPTNVRQPVHGQVTLAR